MFMTGTVHFSSFQVPTSRHKVYGVIIAKYVSTKAVHLMDCRHHIP